MIATAIFTGVRLGELLGLRSSDADFEAGVLRVHRQLDRDGSLVEPKTPQAKRDVVLMPALVRVLKEHRIASPFSTPADLIFPNAVGTGASETVARDALRASMKRAGLKDREPFRWHDLRHTYARLLIASGANVPFVSRQLGHADPSITLKVYAHLFEAAEHAAKTTAALEAEFGAVLS